MGFYLISIKIFAKIVVIKVQNTILRISILQGLICKHSSNIYG